MVSSRRPRLWSSGSAGILAPSLSAIAGTFEARLFSGLCALAVFGAGLGLFLAPNNNKTISAAPPELAGEAGPFAMLVIVAVLAACLSLVRDCTAA